MTFVNFHDINVIIISFVFIRSSILSMLMLVYNSRVCKNVQDIAV